MFGWKTIRADEYEAQQRKISALESEVKGYMENEKAGNAYFASISPLLKGEDIDNIMAAIKRADLKTAYESCAPVYGIINRIAMAVGEMFTCLELQQFKDGKWVDVEEHWILNLLHNPNDRFSCQRFGQAWSINRMVYGDATVYTKAQTGKEYGQAKDMYIIPGFRVKINKGGYKEPLSGIIISGGSKQEEIKKEDFFMSFNYNLDDTSFYGTSPLAVAAIYLSIIDRGMARQDLSLKNGGPTAIVTPKPDNLGVMPVTADDVTEQLNGKDVKGQIKALRAAIELHELGSSPVDLNILASHKEAVNVLCFLYNMPVDLYYGQAKYENMKEAKMALYESCAIPMANEFAEDLLSHFNLTEQGYRLTVNTDRVDVLQENPTDVLTNLNLMGATLNEKREAYGYERIEEDWADKPMIPMSTVFGGEAFGDIDENV